MDKSHSKLEMGTPDRQRLPQVIRASRESIIENWLQAVKQDSEIGSIPIPDSERKEHMLLILEAATGVVEGKELTAEGRKGYLRQGAIRYKQDRTVSLLMSGRQAIAGFPRGLHPASVCRHRDELFGIRYDSFDGND